ncbi:hypothetical protein EZV62_017258 [Acer yangbiense]|uniref:Disease resistance N-terminal domain-containing protein n=1 Tax=Acer yangbiense TaxID=1000413 RepID=A0A5C7HGX3_9ROSI|nr:hypothetical protein EZV62_017258 [Acer yangbiense]
MMMHYTELQTLHITSSCDSLTFFPLDLANKVENLQIQNCSHLKCIQLSKDLCQELKFLQDLDISDCDDLEFFSGRGMQTPNLTSLSLSNCKNLTSMPEQMHTLLTSLQALCLSYCPKLESFPNGGLPPNLHLLLIENCDHLTPQKDWGLNKMASLTRLTIIGGCSNLKSFPEEGLLPASLISLQVGELPKLEILNLRGIQFLTSLKGLHINSCNKLHCLSEGKLPISLSSLSITGCSLMSERCQQNQGEDWPKISHIANKDPTLLPPAVKASHIEETEGRDSLLEITGEKNVKQDNMAGGIMAGGSLLSAYLQGLLDKLTSGEFVESFLRGQKLVPLVRNLVETMLTVNTVLDDADEKQFKNPAIRRWHNELIEVIYDLGDLMEEINTEALKPKVMEVKSHTDISTASTWHDKAKSFPTLETLVFQGMSKWQEWISPEVEGVEFPCLQELCIRRCPKLKRLPNRLDTSKRIEISECPALPQLSDVPHSQFFSGNKEQFRSDGKQIHRPLRHPVIEALQLLDSNMVQFRSDDEVASQHSEQRTEATTTTHSYFQSSSKLSTEDPMVRFEPDARNDTSYVEDSFQSLKVTEISQLMELPPGLHRLKIEGCDALKSVPEELMHSNPYLQHLYIIDCCFLKSFHGGYPPTFLKTLYIRSCRKLEFLPPGETMRQYPLLEHLCIGSSCDSLRSLPLASFPKLKSLLVWDCANFSTISITKDHMSIDALEIGDCPKLVSFPKIGLLTPNLTSILIYNCMNLKVLPEQLHKLRSLQSLFINECPELESIPNGGFPNSLSSLCINSCHKLTPNTSWGLHKLENLTRFEIEGGCKNLESFPEQKLLPNSLNSLRICRLPNLKFLDYTGLQHLAFLKTLEINCCNKLQCLPEEGLPSSLTCLYIKECSLLKPKLQKRKGKDWYNIAHIPCIQIDEQIIS